MKLLILGGSGQLSGRVAEMALEAGHEVWTLTRGLRPLPEGVHGLTADRADDAAVRRALEDAHTRWDAAVDCTSRTEIHAQQDIDLLPRFTRRVAVVSTDSVYHPYHKTVPQTEDAPVYLTDGGYGAHKRLMEEVFLGSDALAWTIFRPGHIFGPGFLLGCYPEQSRQAGLLEQMRAERPLRLVGGGSFLIHPIFVDDMALALLDCLDKPATHGQIYCIGGPDVITNADYYRCIGRIIGHEATVEEIPLEGYLEAHPEFSGHLCHRSYCLDKLRAAGVRMPCVSLEEGLRRQIAWLDAQ